MRDFKSQEWINGNGPLGGHRANVRKNISLATVPKDKYPYTFLLSLIYRAKAADGTPSDGDEWKRLDRTEEAVADKFCSVHGALLGLIVTSDGTRDVFLFLPRHPDEDSLDALIQSANPEVDYYFKIIHDPTWKPYENILAKKDDVA